MWVTGCVAAPPAASRADADQHLLASISIAKSGHSNPVRGKTGFFFYVVGTPPQMAGPILEGYEFRDGKQVDAFDGGSESAAVVKAIEKVGLTPFDFDREVAAVTARLAQQAKDRGEEFLETGSRDGAEWDIVIVTGSGKFSLHAWNPGGTIDTYAAHSEKLAKLKKVVDLLAQYYGRLKIAP